MSSRTIYERLKEAAHMADVIEAAESGYISLDADSIRALDVILADELEEITAEQKQKAASAATLATNEDTINH